MDNTEYDRHAQQVSARMAERHAQHERELAERPTYPRQPAGTSAASLAGREAARRVLRAHRVVRDEPINTADDVKRGRP